MASFFEIEYAQPPVDGYLSHLHYHTRWTIFVNILSPILSYIYVCMIIRTTPHGVYSTKGLSKRHNDIDKDTFLAGAENVYKGGVYHRRSGDVGSIGAFACAIRP